MRLRQFTQRLVGFGQEGIQPRVGKPGTLLFADEDQRLAWLAGGEQGVGIEIGQRAVAGVRGHGARQQLDCPRGLPLIQRQFRLEGQHHGGGGFAGIQPG